MNPFETPIRRLTLVISVPLLISSLIAIYLAAWGSEATYLTWAGFEGVLAVTGLVGVLFGIGRFRQGVAMTLLCIAGAMFAATILGRLSVLASPGQTLRDPWVLARVGAAGLLVLAAIPGGLSNDRESWTTFSKGAFFGGLFVLGCAVAWLFRDTLLHPAESVVGVARIVGVLVGAVVLAVLLCIAAHLLIRAFETAPSGPQKA